MLNSFLVMAIQNMMFEVGLTGNIRQAFQPAANQ